MWRRRILTVLVVAVATCAGGLLWLAEGDAGEAVAPVVGAARELVDAAR
ncbi:MAG: hypothetical protein H6732_11785 [Alphaproteobacteria bacterium]|nr:hypothetical protein [Alphaproteobacteria bacterium]